RDDCRVDEDLVLGGVEVFHHLLVPLVLRGGERVVPELHDLAVTCFGILVRGLARGSAAAGGQQCGRGQQCGADAEAAAGGCGHHSFSSLRSVLVGCWAVCRGGFSPVAAVVLRPAAAPGGRRGSPGTSTRSRTGRRCACSHYRARW